MMQKTIGRLEVNGLKFRGPVSNSFFEWASDCTQIRRIKRLMYPWEYYVYMYIARNSTVIQLLHWTVRNECYFMQLNESNLRKNWRNSQTNLRNISESLTSNFSIHTCSFLIQSTARTQLICIVFDQVALKRLRNFQCCGSCLPGDTIQSTNWNWRAARFNYLPIESSKIWNQAFHERTALCQLILGGNVYYWSMISPVFVKNSWQVQKLMTEDEL